MYLERHDVAEICSQPQCVIVWKSAVERGIVFAKPMTMKTMLLAALMIGCGGEAPALQIRITNIHAHRDACPDWQTIESAFPAPDRIEIELSGGILGCVYDLDSRGAGCTWTAPLPAPSNNFTECFYRAESEVINSD